MSKKSKIVGVTAASNEYASKSQDVRIHHPFGLQLQDWGSTKQ